MPDFERNHAVFGNHRDFIWDISYTSKKASKYHATVEDWRLPDEPSTLRRSHSVIQGLLEIDANALSPPSHSFHALQQFLLQAGDVDLSGPLPVRNGRPKVALVDDRRDDRDSEGPTRHAKGFVSRDLAPPGANIRSTALDESGLHRRLLEKREQNRAERRVIYLTNLSSQCALVLIDTVPRRWATHLRDFLERYVTKRAMFLLSLESFGFALEFHIPYLSLRRRGAGKDNRKGLRISRDLPLPMDKTQADAEYHEAQISFLLVGPDEWFWTAYCCVDTFFGSEKDPEEWLTDDTDPPSGFKPLSEPIWDPREYFVIVLSRRMQQVSQEWSNLVAAVLARLATYESGYNDDIVQGRFFDDPDYSGTIRYTRAVLVLRRLREVLGQTLHAWDAFARLEAQCLTVDDGSEGQGWTEHILILSAAMAQLRYLDRTLESKIQTFDRMKDDLMNASALRESRAATSQGVNISVLTYTTVVYLPFSLSTGIFSMSMLSSSTSWTWALLTAVVLSCITFPIAFGAPRLLHFLAAQRQRAGL